MYLAGILEHSSQNQRGHVNLRLGFSKTPLFSMMLNLAGTWLVQK